MRGGKSAAAAWRAGTGDARTPVGKPICGSPQLLTFIVQTGDLFELPRSWLCINEPETSFTLHGQKIGAGRAGDASLGRGRASWEGRD